MVKAQLVLIKTGEITFYGLRAESGEFGIPSDSVLIDSLEPELNEPELNFQTVTWVVGEKQVRVVSLSDFDVMLHYLNGGNGTPASDIICNLLGRSLEEVFIEAFKAI